MIEQASWIWLDGADREYDCHLLFRREFQVPGKMIKGSLKIAVSDQYRLFVNGERIGDGPARFELPNVYYDEYDLSGLRLKKGRNVLAVMTRNTMLAQHGQALGDGGIWVALTGKTTSGKRIQIGTDRQWRVKRPEWFQKPAPRRFFPVGFNVQVDFSRLDPNWAASSYDDSDWENAAEVKRDCYRNLMPRPIPPLRFEDWSMASCRRAGTIGELDGVLGLAFCQCENLPWRRELTFVSAIYSPSQRKVTLEYGCDNWSKVSINGEKCWEQGQPDHGFTDHLESERKSYDGMIHGHGIRMEPGCSRGSAADPINELTLKKGWNEIKVWLWRPDRAYGFELCFRDRQGNRLPVKCSAEREKNTANSWGILGAGGKVSRVETCVDDIRPWLEPSHLFDWDTQEVAGRAPAGASRIIKGKGKELSLKPNSFVEFQLPGDASGFVELEVKGPKGALVDFTITEGQTSAGRMRSLYNGLWQTDRLVLSGKWDRWSSFERRSGRYIALTVRSSSGPVKVRQLYLRTMHYPAERVGRFRCSDQVFNWMWEAGARTMDASTFDVAEDCPTREQAQWTGDSYLRVHQLAYLWGDVRLAAKGVREMAADQKRHRWSRPIIPSGYGDKLVDYSFFLPRWAWECYEYDGDVRLLEDAFTGIKNLFLHAEDTCDRRGFAQMGDDRGCAYGDYTFTHKRRRAPFCMLQAVYYEALVTAAKVAVTLGRKRLANQWLKRAEKLLRQLRKAFWVPEKGLFCDNIADGKQSEECSASTNYWTLWANVPSSHQEKQILKQLWLSPDEENLSHWVNGESPYTKHFSSLALLERGLWQEAFASWRGFYRTMMQHPESWCAFEWWERSIPPKIGSARSSLVHPFGIGPMACLLSYVAGIRPLEPGRKALLWEPIPGDLEWFDASVPIVGDGGFVSVRLQSGDSGRILTLEYELAANIQLSRRFLAESDVTMVNGEEWW